MLDTIEDDKEGLPERRAAKAVEQRRDREGVHIHLQGILLSPCALHPPTCPFRACAVQSVVQSPGTAHARWVLRCKPRCMEPQVHTQYGMNGGGIMRGV